MKVKKRIDLKVGYRCNNNCRFCVIANKRTAGDRTKEEIFHDLEEAKYSGAKEVVLTGGEFTIRKDALEIVSYAKELGYKGIQLQTNGRMLAYKNFLEKLAGYDIEFTPAIHGHNAEVHDFLTRSEGSFRQTLKGLHNLKELGIPIRTNSVITKPNYRHLPQLAQMLIDIGVEQFQLAFPHPVGNAWNYFDSVVPLKSLIKQFLHKSLELAEASGVKVMVEAYPYCFMVGYERYCSELYIPDIDIIEFNTITDFTKYRKGNGKAKSEKCVSCRYALVCEGPWREYVEKRGWDEFTPIEGTKISSTAEFFKNG